MTQWCLSEEHCFFFLLFYLFSFVGNKTNRKQMIMSQRSVLNGFHVAELLQVDETEGGFPRRYLGPVQAAGAVEAAAPRRLISSNDETAGGHFPAGSKPFGGSRLEIWVTEMNGTAAILTVHPGPMGRPHCANAAISLSPEARSGICYKRPRRCRSRRHFCLTQTVC